MKVEDIKLRHNLARLNENGKWQPSTTRFYRREDGTMHVFELSERKIRIYQYEKMKLYGFAMEQTLMMGKLVHGSTVVNKVFLSLLILAIDQ